MKPATITNDWLKTAKCVPCEGGVAPIPEKNAKEEYLPNLKKDWEIINGTSIEREFKFNNFVEALEFVKKIAVLAEQENHHPDICIHYNKVKLTLTTHAISGLSENDFILAAKIEDL